MNIKHDFDNETLVILLEENNGVVCIEDIDLYIKSLAGLINSVSSRELSEVCFDLSKKLFLNSTGLSQLVKLKDFLVDREKQISIKNASQKVLSLFSMVGLDNFITVQR
ncbi:MAG TPA: STAS domain-containing protein [Spirochaetota bacterium]|nr:STAS domain-containing protein [Spirochaetota bacterium]HPI89304.1 STAS domain-containing protein [Spirochaetota bacterium]HPR48541.1 STAS domain-containing protein [Spirochaetota bacterium]